MVAKGGTKTAGSARKQSPKSGAKARAPGNVAKARAPGNGAKPRAPGNGAKARDPGNGAKARAPGNVAKVRAARGRTAAGREPRPASRRASKRAVRYAVVGLGHIAQAAVLPAFAHARRNSKLAALISDDAVKLRELSKRYRVEQTFGYEDYDEALRGGDIDAVYIALPNHLHREYTIRAAKAGVHVLCEKPMAVTVDDCDAMIEACHEGGVRLMVAYRLHFDPANLEALKLASSGKLGHVRMFDSTFSMHVKEGDIRLKRALGGGTLYDIGVYCINAARTLFRSEPMEVFAFSVNNGEPRFREVDEMTGAVLTFPDARLATFLTSFGAADVARYQVVGTQGVLRVEDAYEYATGARHTLTIGGRTRRLEFPKHDQFAPELEHFSECVLTGREPEPSGLEGRIDVEIVQALYRSAEIGRPVAYEGPEKSRRPSPEQEMLAPPVSKERELVHAESPSED